MTPCPDFDLAEFTPYDPAILRRDGDDPAGAFVLSLALAYNDLKSLQWMVQQLASGRPDDPTAVNPYNGQFHGMQIYISRMTVGLVQEVLKAVETAATNGVLENQDFKDACLAAEKEFPSVRSKWDGLVKLSKGEHAELEGLSKFLIKVRNNVAYHYYQPKQLLKGYRRVFFEDEKAKHNESALASLGDNLETTRFYMADAAAGATLTDLVPDGRDQLEQTKKLVDILNLLFRTIIQCFFEIRALSCR